VALAEVVQSGHCEAGVGPQFDDRVREGGLQTRDDGLQCGQDILGGVGIAGPQESAEDATRAAFVDQQRMVHVLVEKPVEGDELLLPVGRVVRASGNVGKGGLSSGRRSCLGKEAGRA